MLTPVAKPSPAPSTLTILLTFERDLSALTVELPVTQTKWIITRDNWTITAGKEILPNTSPGMPLFVMLMLWFHVKGKGTIPATPCRLSDAEVVTLNNAMTMAKSRMKKGGTGSAWFRAVFPDGNWNRKTTAKVSACAASSSLREEKAGPC